MNIRNTLVAAFAAAALIACGAGQSPKEGTVAQGSETKPEHGDHHKMGHGDHHEKGHGDHHAGHDKKPHKEFPATVSTFHDQMAPLWHAAKGDKRTNETCTAVDDLRKAAVAVEADAVPEKAKAKADEWKAAAKELIAATDNLKVACDQPKRPDFEGTFMKLHHAFHGLVKLVGHKH